MSGTIVDMYSCIIHDPYYVYFCAANIYIEDKERKYDNDDD